MVLKDDKLISLQRKFREFYNQNLKRNYQELEKMREEYNLIFRARVFLSMIGLFILVLINVLFLNCTFEVCRILADPELLGRANLFCLFIVVCYCSMPFIEYKKKTKSLVMRKILSFFGDFKYKLEDACSEDNRYRSNITKGLINKTELFSDLIATKDQDDCFSGVYQETKINVEELKLNVFQDEDDVREIFSGIMILLAMPKKFVGKVVVREKSSANSFTSSPYFDSIMFFIFFAMGMLPLGLLLTDSDIDFGMRVFILIGVSIGFLMVMIANYNRAMEEKKRKTAKQDINLEDVTFDKHWVVKATDQVEARYVLTPALMERILEVKRRFHGKSIEFSFFDNKVLIAVHTNKDMFETTGLFTSALSYHKIEEVVEQFYSVFSVVELLGKR